jgi:hypothetical protein
MNSGPVAWGTPHVPTPGGGTTCQKPTDEDLATMDQSLPSIEAFDRRQSP